MTVKEVLISNHIFSRVQKTPPAIDQIRKRPALVVFWTEESVMGGYISKVALHQEAWFPLANSFNGKGNFFAEGPIEGNIWIISLFEDSQIAAFFAALAGIKVITI